MATGHRSGPLETPLLAAHFVSELLHETNTSLASLSILAELIAQAAQEHGSATESAHAQRQREVLADLSGLLSDAGTIARLVAGRVTLEPTAIDLRALVDEILETPSSQTDIVYDLAIDPTIGAVDADPEQLRMLVAELIEAAREMATDRVRLRANKRNGAVWLEVGWEGPALEAISTLDPAASLLDAFSRNSGAPPRRRGGQSLGLAVAAERARILGAVLEVVNTHNGPAFVLDMPVAPDA